MPAYPRAAAVAAVFFAVAFTTSFAPAQQATEATFRVEDADLDLGAMVAGTTVSATFVFHNDGSDDIHIFRAKPS